MPLARFFARSARQDEQMLKNRIGVFTLQKCIADSDAGGAVAPLLAPTTGDRSAAASARERPMATGSTWTHRWQG